MEFFRNLRIVPRWLIVLIDTLIVFHATFFAYFVRFNFNFDQIDRFQILPSVFVFTGFVLISMLITRSYVGIVRHTSTGDLVNMMKMLGLAHVFLYVVRQLNLIYGFEETTFFVPLSVSLIAALLSFPLLISYRLLVKEFYYYMSNSKHKEIAKKVAIYGAGEAGILTYQALKSNANAQWNPVAFIDDDPIKAGKLLEGKKIYYGTEGLRKAVEKSGVEEVVIAINSLSSANKRRIIDTCLELGLPSKIIPPAKDWFEVGLKTQDIREVRIEDLLSRDEINLEKENVQESIKGKVVLVTGAAGSIGSELCRQLIHCKPKNLLMLDQAESALYELDQDLSLINKNTPRRALVADIRNKNRMMEIFIEYKPDLVYHAAAYKHVPLMEEFPEEAIRVNVMGTKILADLSSYFGVEKFVMVSTDKAVNPTNVMGASKRAAEIYVQSLDYHHHFQGDNSHTKFITTRFGNVLGSNGSVIPLFQKQIKRGGPLTITHPEITRYFMTIPEACQLVLEAGSMGDGGEIYVFDMGEPVKILDLAKKMVFLSGKKLGHDIEITYSGLRPGEKLYEELLNDFEKVKETYHPKIKIAQVSPKNYGYVEEMFNRFKNLLENGKEDQLVTHLKELVPEFISQESRFSKLDEEKKLLN
ncbi:polysaccharide biosynthesis protein [Shivajiella indica]|uniref:Polysaccharide biosynthesis protein n=1 Tax=Shivajiella indica TaxID=872115 RepID=A0ABW5B559_9BACT